MRPIDLIERGVVLPRHGHAAPYAAVVLAGSYEEAGDGGRFRAEAGDVLIHAGFSAHLDRADRATRVLNLPLPWLWAGRSTRMSIDDPDALARLAERDLRAAGSRLLATLRPGKPGLEDEVDALAAAFTCSSEHRLSDWSGARGVSRGTVWRRFTMAYGVGPSRYRVEARTRRAWRRLVAGEDRLSEIAVAEGFADQAHMSRAVRALTGRTPGQWRTVRHSFKTAPG